MDFAVLGALRVTVNSRPVPIGSARQRAVLAALLLSANETVSIPRLIGAVWGDRPAGSAQSLVHTYVWRLRSLLAENGERRLLTAPTGYLLRVEPGELDLAEFQRLAGEGSAALAAGDTAQAAAKLRAALALWRGEPFADVVQYDGEFVVEAHRLAEARVAAWEDRIEADLLLGRHEGLTGELRQLALRHPLRERIAGQLMLACYRSGRQGDALAAYARIRAELVAELGMDPGPELRELHQRILRADPALLAGPTGRRSAVAALGRIVPRQLPAAPAHFAGREDELKALTRLLEHNLRADGAGTVVISAIGGGAGIGKTALALWWAHRNVESFPDGQLHVNLRGFAPEAEAVTPAEAVRGFLDALAVSADRVPRGLNAQAALYRSLVAGKRMLVVLDNARDTDQVRPLLPGGPGCLTLITSRDRLAGLVAAEHASPIGVDVLTETEARELLAQRLGAGRVAAEAEAVSVLIGLCARLPLALSIAAARVTLDPALPVADLVAELHDVRDRLDALDIGDSTTDPRAVFSWSHRRLAEPAARLFRLLAVHPGPDITAAAAASLAGVPRDEARRLLDELTRAHLLSEHTSGRYAFHDLLRAYAAEQARACDTRDGRDERRAALQRVLDHYLHSARAATQLVSASRNPISLPPPRPGTQPESFAADPEARSWLEAEQPVLLAAVARAAAEGLDVHGRLLPWVLANYLDQRGYWRDYVALQRTALAAAQRSAGLAEQARAHRLLGSAYARLDMYQDAHSHLQHALELNRRLGDRVGQAHAHLAVASMFNQQDRHREALDPVEQALELFRAADRRAGQADSLNGLGWLHSQLGDHQRALTYCRQALALYRDLGDRFGEAHARDSLGHACHRLGLHAQALTYYRQAVDLFRKAGDGYSQAGTFTRIGDMQHANGNTQAAHEEWRQALTLLDDLQHPDAELLRAKLGIADLPEHPSAQT
ncbi:MAG: AfsR/SARP family transcriptional regulator [Catenulispora sp.]